MAFHPIEAKYQERAVKGELVEFKLDNKSLILTRHQSKWYAFDSKCPHANGPLADGYIDQNNCIVCPWHKYPFELKNGKAHKGERDLQTYKVREKKGELLIEWKGEEKKKGFWSWFK